MNIQYIYNTQLVQKIQNIYTRVNVDSISQTWVNHLTETTGITF